jgi:hypothetical protein
VIPPTFGLSLLTPSHLLLCFSIPLTVPPRKQPPQQDLEEEDDDLVTGKQLKEMMHMMESLIASMNETFNKTTMSTNEMLHKSQASTETTLEQMQHGIAAMADRCHGVGHFQRDCPNKKSYIATDDGGYVSASVVEDDFALQTNNPGDLDDDDVKVFGSEHTEEYNTKTYVV